MRWLTETCRKVMMLLRRRQLEADLEEEMRFHLEMRAEEHREAGSRMEEASYAARRRFGNLTSLREKARAEWGWPWAESVAHDIRFALRALRKSPALVAVSLVSLALGVGVNVAIFSFIDGLFLRPLPAIGQSDRLVSIYQRFRSGANGFTSSAYPDFEYYRAHNHSFSDVLAYTTFPMTIRIGDQGEQVNGQLVSPNYFSVLRVTPALGRLFVPSGKTVRGADPLVVLGFEFWQRRFGGDPAVLGRTLRVGKAGLTIVGVAPPGFQGVALDWSEAPALWVPATMYGEAVPELADGDFLHSWGAQTYDLVGRLKPGVTVRDAVADMNTAGKRIMIDNPERAAAWPREIVDYGHCGPVLYPSLQSRFSPDARGSVIGFLGLLAAVAALIFLVACFNVASLVFARTMHREHELALRLSLGAGRARLVRQLLTENLVLALLGSAGGLLVGRWTSIVLSRFGQGFHGPLSIDASLDGRVLAFAAVAGVVCGIALTLLPARLASRAGINPALKSDTRTGGRGALRAHAVLVTTQVALSVVLLVSAGLFVRTLQNAHATDPTLRPDEVLLAKLDLASAGYDAGRGTALYSQLLERVRSLPGVRDGALVFVVPLGGRRGGTNIVLEPQDSTTAKRPVQVGFNVVTPGYFHTIGLPVMAGRDFRDADRQGSLPVAVINEVMAQRLFPGRNPIGHRFLLQWPPARTVEVTGVVRDGRFRTYRAEMEPTVYVPLAQWYAGEMNLEVRAAAGGSEIAPSIRRELAALDKDLALARVETVKRHFDNALAQERLTAFLLSALGLLALLLAAVGIYGILAYSVARRIREIGIRMALGARPGSIRRIVLGRVIRLMVVGLGAGTVAALALARLVRGLLFGVEPTDPTTFLIAIAALVAAATLAAWIPARRAAKADPLVALRYE